MRRAELGLWCGERMLRFNSERDMRWLCARAPRPTRPRRVRDGFGGGSGREGRVRRPLCRGEQLADFGRVGVASWRRKVVGNEVGE